MKPDRTSLYPPLDPYEIGWLPVSTLHTLYWEQCGNPNGIPVLFLHGGPGGGCSPRHRRFFDPAVYRIVLFDQRGAGKSVPAGECHDNTTQRLVEDIEVLREMLGIQRWLVFGGSWGSTLGLAYGQAHPERCLGFILRGIFLARLAEVQWFMYGIRHIFPEAWQHFAQQVPLEEHSDLLSAYAKRLFDPNPEVHLPFARAWGHYEGSCSHLLASASAASAAHFENNAVALGLARLECHYMRHGAFMAEGELLRQLPRIQHLPCTIVQGRYDMVCPIMTADELQKNWPGCHYVVVPDAGHSAWETGICAALVAACEQMKERLLLSLATA